MCDEEGAVFLTAIMREYPHNWRNFLSLPDEDVVGLRAFQGYALILPALVEAGHAAMDELRAVRAEVRRRLVSVQKNRRPMSDGASGIAK